LLATTQFAVPASSEFQRAYPHVEALSTVPRARSGNTSSQERPDRQLHYLLQRPHPLPAPGAPGKNRRHPGRRSHQEDFPHRLADVNLQGRFEFLKVPDASNVDTIIRVLTTAQASRIVNLIA
jgi:hypothetical protein